ncbi:MAG TPA: YbaK/EbsC family protein, partial [Acetobacteraceae bacterium]|nr:YbaK/EbsC family protein [Acetobacteraceae bacterium]
SATEAEIARLFDGCDFGAVPPVGAAYGLPVLLDESLDGASELYFQGGDHTTAGARHRRRVQGADEGRAPGALQPSRSGCLAKRAERAVDACQALRGTSRTTLAVRLCAPLS